MGVVRREGEGLGRHEAQARSDGAQGAAYTNVPDRTDCARPNLSMVGWDRFSQNASNVS